MQWWADELLSKISDELECMGEWICLRLLWLLHNDNEDNKNTIISNIFWHLLSPPGHLTHNQNSLNFSNIAISLSFSQIPDLKYFYLSFLISDPYPIILSCLVCHQVSLCSGVILKTLACEDTYLLLLLFLLLFLLKTMSSLLSFLFFLHFLFSLPSFLLSLILNRSKLYSVFFYLVYNGAHPIPREA